MPRKKKKFHFIYKTTNLLSGKYYIGMHSTDNLEDGYLGSGKRLRYSINKYGAKNHEREILEFLDSREELKKREEEIVNLNEIAKERCMNLVVGGQGGFSSEQAKLGRKATDKILIEKYGSNFKSKIAKNFWNNISEKDKNELIKKNKDGQIRVGFDHATFKNKKHTEDTKKLMSNIRKGTGTGKKNSQFGTCWITNSLENKKIKKQELETYIQQGWVKGRKLKQQKK